MAQIVTRDSFIETMEPRMRELFTYGLQEGDAWKRMWDVKDSDMRREEIGEFRRPSVVIETPEGAPLAELTTEFIRTSSVVHLDYTGMIVVTHQMKRDKKYDEMEDNTWGLGDAVSRKLYKEATRLFYSGFEGGGATSSDGNPWFSDDHPLQNAPGVVDVNLLDDVLGPEGLKNAFKLLMETKDENGDITQMGMGECDLFVAADNDILAKQLADMGQYLPGSAEFNINKFKINPFTIPLLAEAPAAYRDSQWYLRDRKRAKNTCFMREGPTFKMVTDELTDNTIIKTRVSFSFLIGPHRGTIGSKGQG